MDINDISKIVKDFPIKKLPNSHRYYARPYIDGKRVYISGASKSETRTNLALHFVEHFGMKLEHPEDVEKWTDVISQIKKQQKAQLKLQKEAQMLELKKQKEEQIQREQLRKLAIEKEKKKKQLQKQRKMKRKKERIKDEDPNPNFRPYSRKKSSEQIAMERNIDPSTWNWKDTSIRNDDIEYQQVLPIYSDTMFSEWEEPKVDPMMPILFNNSGANAFQVETMESFSQFRTQKVVARDDLPMNYYENLPMIHGQYQSQVQYQNYNDMFSITTSTGAEVMNQLSTVSLNSYIEYWLVNYKKLTLEPTTYERMVIVYEYHVRDTIGVKPITKVTEQDIQMLINYRANPLDGSKPLSMSGLKKIKELLSPCLDRAVYDGIIPRNPCKGVYFPKERYLAAEKKKQFTMTDRQIQDFETACRMKLASGEYRSRDGLVLLFILNLGLRVGEAVALEWDDIDMGRSLIFVNKTIQYTKEYGEQVKEGTKTEAGNRVLPINDTVYQLLEEMKAYDQRKGISSPYVCCSLEGTRKNCRNLQRSMERILNYTDITAHITLHTLRHTFGSTLLRRGVSIEVISQLMGHSNITITYNKYIHVLQEQKALALKTVSVT